MILIRGIVGLVFFTEGLLKILLSGEFGTGALAAIGFPFPAILAPVVGGIEMLCGAAIFFGLFAGNAALLLLPVNLTALISTRIPVLLGRRFGPFAFPFLPHYGWLSFFHEARVDLFLLVALIAIMIDSGVHLVRKRRWYQGS
jgi:uncharacterized membrane protein YphA (DoxX/SURF4 family)